MSLAVLLTPAELEALLERAVHKALDARQPAPDSEVMTRAQVAALLKCDVRTVDAHMKRGLPFSKVNRQPRYVRAEVLAWLKEQH